MQKTHPDYRGQCADRHPDPLIRETGRKPRSAVCSRSHARRDLLAWSPCNKDNRRLAPIVCMLVLGMPLVSGCSNQSHILPFQWTPNQPFSRAAIVAISLREWRRFGEQVNDDDHLNWDKPERNEGLWQRVGEYWYVGMNPGTIESHWTGKHDEYGHEFPLEDDGKYAWSAAFVSYVMRIAGAGSAFPYSPDHAVYINAAKRMTLGTDHGWLVRAERPDAYAPVPGDLICYGRDQAASLRYDDLPTAELFPSHCDIVVEGPKVGVITPVISVIGGNVQDAVTMRHVPVTAEGRLARPDGVVLDQRWPWMVVLRVHEPASGS